MDIKLDPESFTNNLETSSPSRKGAGEDNQGLDQIVPRIIEKIAALREEIKAVSLIRTKIRAGWYAMYGPDQNSTRSHKSSGPFDDQLDTAFMGVVGGPIEVGGVT